MARGRKAISPARKIALEVLRRVEAEGAYVNICLNHSLERHPNLAARDRALATELVYGTLRWRRRLDWALAAHCRRPPDKIEPKLLRILRMGAYQLLMLDGISDWAAVDQAVELASVMRGRRAGGFVNGVLRALVRGKAALDWPSENEDLVRYLGVTYSFPDWLVEQWLERFGRDGAEDLMKALNQPASTWLRVNTLRVTTDALAELLLASGVDVRTSKKVPQALECRAAGNLASHAAHQSGLFHIQDGAAQLVCHLLDVRPGMRVLDACAAPGGKTATVAELMENRGELLAADINPARLSLVRKLAERLGIECVHTRMADMSDRLPEDLGKFDRVLLDAPCTATGTIRRHPEIKWRLLPGDVEQLCQLQRKLLENAAGLVAEDGVLVYSVCSLDDREGRMQVREFVERHPEFELVDPRRVSQTRWEPYTDSEGFVWIWPPAHGLDGFFAARLKRRKGG